MYIEPYGIQATPATSLLVAPVYLQLSKCSWAPVENDYILLIILKILSIFLYTPPLSSTYFFCFALFLHISWEVGFFLEKMFSWLLDQI